jgi:hypothetical protein
VVRWGSPHIAQLFALGHAGRSLGAHVTLPQSLGISLEWWIDALTASPPGRRCWFSCPSSIQPSLRRTLRWTG